MPTDAFTVLVTEGSDPKPLDWLRTQARVVEVRYDDPAFDAHLAAADGMVVRTYTKVTDALLAKAPRLKVVGRGGVGLENIDVAACRRRGVEVVYTPDANTLAVGDFVFGYLLQLLRPWAFFKETRVRAQGVQAGPRHRPRPATQRADARHPGHGPRRPARRPHRRQRVRHAGDLQRPARRRRAGSTSPPPPVDKPTLYREADVLSLHVDMLPGNENLVGREQLALMKPYGRRRQHQPRRGARRRRPGRRPCGTSRSPAPPSTSSAPSRPRPDFPLLGLDNVLLTPHLAARTYTAMENMSWVVRDVIDVLHGRPPKYPAP